MRRILITLLLIAFSFPARADIDWVSLVWHNDMFVFRDGGGYTNGAYISLADLSYEGQFARAPLLTRPFAWLLADDMDMAISVYTLGQAMVTPKDISKPIPDPRDAPYAGVLALQSSYIAIYGHHADTLAVTLGILGPSSGAEEVQKFIHNITDSTDPQGWDYQLKDEPVGQLHYMRTWRSFSDRASAVDALIFAQGNIGNLESGIGTGFMLRAGSGLTRSFPSATLITGRVINPIAIEGGWFIYAGAMAEYVHNQIFINGNTFRTSPSSNLRHEQYTFLAGLAYSWENFSITLAFKDGTSLDRHNTARQQFGAITLGWRL